MHHRRILVSMGLTYAGIMGAVLAWAGLDWWVHQWRPSHR